MHTHTYTNRHTYIYIYRNPLYVCMSSVPLIIVGGPIYPRIPEKNKIKTRHGHGHGQVRNEMKWADDFVPGSRYTDTKIHSYSYINKKFFSSIWHQIGLKFFLLFYFVFFVGWMANAIQLFMSHPAWWDFLTKNSTSYWLICQFHKPNKWPETARNI